MLTVTQAEPSAHARALYDYTRQTDEEISFTEDASLEVFDTSDPDWILVGHDGEYGFAPANYIEVSDEAPASTPAPPSLPRRPPQVEPEPEPEPEEEPEPSPPSPQSPVHNQAAALAAVLTGRKAPTPAARAPPPQFTPEASDEDEGPTPSLPARPASVARPPEPVENPRSPSSSGGPTASPPYNRASFNRSMETELFHAPGGFHMYNINEMVEVMGKRKKMPTTLGINTATGVILIAPEKARDGESKSAPILVFTELDELLKRLLVCILIGQKVQS
jgi:hypothetical protein